MKYVLVAVIATAVFWQVKSFDFFRKRLDGPEEVSDKLIMIFT